MLELKVQVEADRWVLDLILIVTNIIICIS